MSQNKPTLVYRRKKHKRNSITVCTMQASGDTKQSNGSHSAISLEAPSVAAEEHMFSASELAKEAVRLPTVLPVECNTGTAESFNGCPVLIETSSEEVLSSDMQRVLNDSCDDDSYSSSKSNVGSSFLKASVDNLGEYSSSGALIAGKLLDDVSEKDIIISIIRSQGLLEKDWTRWNCVSDKDTGITNDNYCSKTCKVCKHVETTLNMLICDNCEDAFHIFCCNPQIKRIPVGEWLCNSCSKKKHKLLEKSTSNSLNISTQIGRNGNSAQESELGSVQFMFRDTEPYMSNVRIGNDFQANVPDWSGPVDNGSDLVGETLKADPSKNVSTRACNSTKPLKLSSMGNWLQCQEIIDGIGGDDGTICGKWRRAPLFEVQTDDWDCFRCVHWDLAHADCSVPQELDTEEVMKQLKYIEMLKPQLAAKRRKMNSSKTNGNGSQDL
ncbi:transcription intermediary factor 1-alpha [Forsythia ovata]|uniref:Transcription intermediary factor 1-alpha n=1 Tax=Forsythia ovata TaxID=205694 RepID=A0ABD1X111_9LAMI